MFLSQDKESVMGEQYETTNGFVAGRKHGEVEEFSPPRDERVWKEGEQDDRVEVFPEVWKTESALEASQRNDFDENFLPNSSKTKQIYMILST